jgi:SSS family solute:Na+ symporter
MLVTSALVVRNCYAAYLDREASEERYLLVGRVVGVAIIAGAVYLSLASYDVFGQLKNAWEIPVIFAAPFWIGMFWRRGTKRAAWITVIFSLIVFVLLPMLLPLMPGLRENQRYAVTTAEVSRTVTRPASPADVARRGLKIQAWRSKAEKEPGAVEPKELKAGEDFMETRITAPRSVFWKDGFVRLSGPEKPAVVTTQEDDSGSRVVTRRYGPETRFRGKGFFNFDFLLYGAIGVDLQGLSREAVEALRLPLKVMVPFLVMIIASLLTRPNSKESLDRFYVKMKTPTEPDPEKDKRELELSYASPDRFDHKKLFQGSSIEIQRPDSMDVVGFILSCLGVVAVILLALWVANLGA